MRRTILACTLMIACPFTFGCGGPSSSEQDASKNSVVTPPAPPTPGKNPSKSGKRGIGEDHLMIIPLPALR
jgi:hypothetical protein